MKQLIWSALAALLLVVMMALPGPAQVAAQNTDCYRMQGGAKWVCDSGGEIEMQTGSTLDVQSGATFLADDLTVADQLTTADLTTSDDLIVGDDATFASDVTFTPQTVITVTNGGAFAPTGALQPIASSGSVTPTITIPSAGKCMTVYNTSATSILIVDTGNQVLAGNFTLGQYDSLSFCSDGTRIIERARSNN